LCTKEVHAQRVHTDTARKEYTQVVQKTVRKKELIG
jgi:hypothetical protein